MPSARRMAGLALALAAGLAGLLGTSASDALAASPFKRCFRHSPIDCAIIRTPLDRSGRVPGTVPLHVIRLQTREARKSGVPTGAVVPLAGGPGQSSLPLAGDYADVMARALRTRDLLVFDQRGTGLSGVLRCPSFQRRHTGDPHKAIQACAARLGPARSFYTSADAADDIEAVRVAEGVDKIMLYGTSYGTKVALAYAQRYPEHVESMILDSVVGLDGPDPFYRDTFQATPRVLRDLCARGACAGITADPVADLAALVRRLQGAPLRGHVVGGDGRRRLRQLGRSSVLDVLVEGDFNPQLRAGFPAAVTAALRGDSAPMLRLARTALVHDYFPPEPPSLFSNALFAATTCEEGPLPWAPTVPFGDRWRTARQQAASLPDSAFAPFDRATAAATDTLRLCAPWPPDAVARPLDPRPLPDVPALILGGAADLRTPAEGALALAAKLPRATTLIVPRTGHDALDTDLSGCASRALERFLVAKPVEPTCPRTSRAIEDLIGVVLYPPTPVPPRHLSQLGTPRHLRGRAGRTLRAAELTFLDALLQILSTDLSAEEPVRLARIGGLREGRLLVRYEPRVSVRLDRYSYVPETWVSAHIRKLSRSRVRLRVGGRKAARGRLLFNVRKDRISGRLGGRRVHVSLTRDIEEAVGGLNVLRSALRQTGRAPSRCCSAGQVLGRR